MDFYENLANAIIIQAVKDYRNAEDEYARAALERFFRSRWYGVLTELDPEELISRLRKEIEDGKKTVRRLRRERRERVYGRRAAP